MKSLWGWMCKNLEDGSRMNEQFFYEYIFTHFFFVKCEPRWNLDNFYFFICNIETYLNWMAVILKIKFVAMYINIYLIQMTNLFVNMLLPAHYIWQCFWNKLWHTKSKFTCTKFSSLVLWVSATFIAKIINFLNSLLAAHRYLI